MKMVKAKKKKERKKRVKAMLEHDKAFAINVEREEQNAYVCARRLWKCKIVVCIARKKCI